MVMLPSSFTGGPRYMHERTQDDMTYVRHFGRPDLFITFTCNPKWKEIEELLVQGQKSHDRHDLIVRIFHVKIKHMMNLLTKGCIFGKTKCHMYTVEWQKRGLPHIHILLWLEEKLRPESIDKVISAELPNQDQDQELYEIIKTNMIHGPCGSFNRNSPCMVDGSCTKKYPKHFMKETQTGEDGYPKYRRRSPEDGGVTTIINEINIDNRWVVPYNPVLCRTFKAHINVEVCNSVKSIKYICEYINKGSDQAAFTVGDLDEVTKYEAGRYISTSEAVWRILSFPIYERFPPVMHLAVHLKNGQRVFFNENHILNQINNSKTTLTAFFELCKVDNFAKKLLYCEVPAYYVWRKHQFHRRKQGKIVPGYLGIKKDHVLGRVYTVHPTNTECYYLRLLLHEVRGPESFTALRTIKDVIYPTFQEACRVMGLLEDDAHGDQTLAEVSISDSSYKIRELFAVMLVFCQVGDPIKLWDKYRDNFTDDIKRRMSRNRENSDLDVDIVYNQCLINLEDMVIAMSGKTLLQFGLTSPSREQEYGIINQQYLNELAYDTDKLTEEVIKSVPILNKEQKEAYESILNSVVSDSGRLFFLDAPGGTGKTFLINLLLAKIRSEKSIAIAVASSGIAATLIDGGKTAHSTFKLPLEMNHSDNILCNISKQSYMAHVIREAKLIVWDECTMAHKNAIEALNRTLKDIRNSDRIMGGITVVLAGDFRQTLPVVPRGTRADEVKACLKSSVLWPHVNVLSLKINMRVHIQHDLRAEEFSKVLIDIGNGQISEVDGRISIPDNLGDIGDDLTTLTDKIYPDINKIGVNCSSWLKERAILTPTNDSANSINNYLIEKLSTNQMKYKSIDTVVEVDDAVHYPVEFLHTLNPPGIPSRILNLKIGAPIMLLRNLNPPKLCNGTRLQVKNLHKNIIEATILTGKHEGEIVFIPRILLVPSDYHFNFKRLQFPVRVCYAMTINKARGRV
ncbi:uncharacterized protein LOC106693783 [Microplitis demolitor]|uniref:uncharacterized protein LOC106693783 n=1 Tax=Microplitis demolitor TaxID=69319 RepID=UPI00235B5B5A|nr:uncharacterized protein LOC106693783 [Microplitis demolitor]